MGHGFRLTALCETCALRYRGSVTGDDRDEVGALVAVMSRGWDELHKGHAQVVVASPIEEPVP